MATVMFLSTLIPLPEEQQCRGDKLASKRETSQAPRLSKQQLVIFLSRWSGYRNNCHTQLSHTHFLLLILVSKSLPVKAATRCPSIFSGGFSSCEDSSSCLGFFKKFLPT